MHEYGHALHYGFTREQRFELARLGNPTVGEAYAALFEDLLEDPVWLEEHAGVSGDKRAQYLAASSAHKLFLIRRAAGTAAVPAGAAPPGGRGREGALQVHHGAHGRHAAEAGGRGALPGGPGGLLPVRGQLPGVVPGGAAPGAAQGALRAGVVAKRRRQGASSRNSGRAATPCPRRRWHRPSARKASNRTCCCCAWAPRSRCPSRWTRRRATRFQRPRRLRPPPPQPRATSRMPGHSPPPHPLSNPARAPLPASSFRG